MTIIDTNKDYYDYLQGVWGRDPKAVYVRKGSHVFDVGDRPVFLSKKLAENVVAYQGEIICRCGDVCHYIYYENKGEGISIEEFMSLRVNVSQEQPPLSLSYSMTAWETGIPKSYASHHSRMPSKEKFITEAVKRHTEPCPPRFRKFMWGPLSPFGFNCKSVDNPILLSLPMTIIPAEKVFSEIQNWLLSCLADKTKEDGRTDVEKLESAGFDRKTSFRKM